MKRLLQNTRLQLVTLAISLLITTTILGLSAYLNDQDSYSAALKVVSKEDFKIEITGEPYNGDVYFAGSSIPINPTVTHVGEYDCYLFAEVDVDEDIFEYDHGFNGDEWIHLSGNVYYYGDENGLLPFSSTDSSTFFDSVTAREDIESSATTQIAITVYAIQTMGYENKSPATVWGDASTIGG